MSIEGVRGGMEPRNWPRLGLILAGVIAVVALGFYGYRTSGIGQQAEKAGCAPGGRLR